MLLLMHRLAAALRTTPDQVAWQAGGRLALLMTVLAVLLNRGSGFLRWRPLRAPLPTLIGIVLVCFVTPALAEEAIFRALLIPRCDEQRSIGSLTFWCIISLSAFVFYHPLKAWLLPARRNAPFADPTFLSLATLTGIVCTASYILSSSLWPSVVLHWIFVLVWLLLLGGWEKMGHKYEE